MVFAHQSALVGETSGTADYSAWQGRRSFKKALNYKLGREGEKAVGQFLERLRVRGAQVLHDIPGEGFNLDHVVIDQSGIYVMETKTRSKPSSGQPKLFFNGQSVSFRQGEEDTKPIIQVRAAANWLRDILQESTGRTFPIRPVVLYPGWFIESSIPFTSSDVWVLNPRALIKIIPKQSLRMKQEDVFLCAYHLSRYCRAAG